jgi:hypothetical protein|tara:strand:+ start:75 stop:287 length:213 start_codon:yes stop_codon:yes gene_type:complete
MKPIQEITIHTNFDKLHPIQVSLDVVIMVPAKSLKEASEIVDMLSHEEMLTLALAHLDFLREDYGHITFN